MKRNVKLLCALACALVLCLSSCVGANVDEITLSPAETASQTPTGEPSPGEPTSEAPTSTPSDGETDAPTEETTAAAPEETTKGETPAPGALTLEQKVAQLFIIAPEQLDPACVTSLTDAAREKLLARCPGGLILFYRNLSTPDALRTFTKALKEASPIAPILSVDEEGGTVARIANADFGVKKYASMGAVGDTGDPENAREAGVTIGAYLRDFGFDLDFAPVADVNSNPYNPVIGRRAFSSDPDLVAKMDRAFIEGMHAAGVKTCLKHFPGHGDTAGDTHEGFVLLDKTLSELYEVELIPFMENLHRTDAVMVAHVNVPSVSGDERPATLSREVVTGLLREKLGFSGLVITDSLQMGAIVNTYGAAEAALLAFEAGCDLLLLPEDYDAAFDAILSAVKSGRVSMAWLDASVDRILRAKGMS